MFGLTRFWQALADLTANLTALSETVGTINTGLRQHVGLDGGDPLALPAPVKCRVCGTPFYSDRAAPYRYCSPACYAQRPRSPRK
jgi:hypothetical protein